MERLMERLIVVAVAIVFLVVATLSTQGCCPCSLYRSYAIHGGTYVGGGRYGAPYVGYYGSSGGYGYAAPTYVQGGYGPYGQRGYVPPVMVPQAYPGGQMGYQPQYLAPVAVPGYPY